MSNTSEWDVAAANNNSAAPDGFPEGMAPSGLNDASREVMAAIARWYAQVNGSLVSAGTANAQTITTDDSHAALSDIPMLAFRAGNTNTSSTTLAVDGLAAKAINLNGSALSGGEIVADQIYIAIYNATNDVFDLFAPANVPDPEAAIPASAFKPDTTTPCANLVSNNIGALEQSYLAFDDATDEKANIQLIAPSSWDGTDIEIKVYWSAPTATTTGDVVWKVNLEATNNNEALDGVADSTQNTTDTHQGADKVDVASTLSFSSLGYAASDLVTIQIERTGSSGSDGLSGDAWFLAMQVKFL